MLNSDGGDDSRIANASPTIKLDRLPDLQHDESLSSSDEDMTPHIHRSRNGNSSDIGASSPNSDNAAGTKHNRRIKLFESTSLVQRCISPRKAPTVGSPKLSSINEAMKNEQHDTLIKSVSGETEQFHHGEKVCKGQARANLFARRAIKPLPFQDDDSMEKEAKFSLLKKETMVEPQEETQTVHVGHPDQPGLRKDRRHFGILSTLGRGIPPPPPLPIDTANPVGEMHDLQLATGTRQPPKHPHNRHKDVGKSHRRRRSHGSGDAIRDHNHENNHTSSVKQRSVSMDHTGSLLRRRVMHGLTRHSPAHSDADGMDASSDQHSATSSELSDTSPIAASPIQEKQPRVLNQVRVVALSIGSSIWVECHKLATQVSQNPVAAKVWVTALDIVLYVVSILLHVLSVVLMGVLYASEKSMLWLVNQAVVRYIVVRLVRLATRRKADANGGTGTAGRPDHIHHARSLDDSSIDDESARGAFHPKKRTLWQKLKVKRARKEVD